VQCGNGSCARRRRVCLRFRGSLISYTRNMYKIKRKVKGQKHNANCTLSVTSAKKMNGIKQFRRLTIFVAEPLPEQMNS